MKNFKVIGLAGIILAIALCVTPVAQADSITVDVNPGSELEKSIRDINGQMPVLGGIIVGYPRSYYGLTYYGFDGSGVWHPYANPPKPIQTMVELAGDTGMSYCRYPGGSVHYYNWKHAVGPVDEREAIYMGRDKDGNPIYDQPVRFGVPEFLKVSQDIGCIPIIVLSYREISLENTDQPYMDGAELVEYLNAPSGTNPNSGTAWADTRDNDRVSLGLEPGPWNVKWFEYGNETYLVALSSSPETTSGEYIDNYFDYQNAMKAVDSSIKLGAVLSGAFKMLPSHAEWTVEIIYGIGQAADFFIMHTYLPSYKGCCDADDTECQNDNPSFPICIDTENLFAVGLAGTNGQQQYIYEEMNSFIYELTGRNDLPIAVTEYNGHFVQNDPVPYRHSLGNALVNADHIRQLMHADNILTSNYHQYSNSYWGMVKSNSGVYTLRPNYYPAFFYNNYFGDILLKRGAVQVDSGSYTYTENDSYYDTSYNVKPASGTYFFEEVLDDELEGVVWDIDDPQPAGVSLASVDGNGVLTIDFSGTDDVEYQHAHKRTTVKTDTWYRLSYLINTENFAVSREGMYLAALSGDNLLQNPGFEDDYLYWDEASYGQPDGAVRSIDEVIAHSGNKSSRIDFSGTDDVNYWETFQTIDVEPETDYLLEGYIKTEAITSNSGMSFEAYDDRGTNYGYWITTALKDTNDWTYTKLQITTTSGAEKITVRQSRKSQGGSEIISGTAWFDDFKLSIKHVTKQVVEDNAWRYVTTDFKSKSFDDNGNGTANIDVYAARNTDGMPISNIVRIKDVKLRELVQGNYGSVPYLSVNVSKSENGDKVYLMVVNKHMTDAVTVSITLNDFVPSSAQALILNGPSIDSTNENEIEVDVIHNNVGLVNNGFSYTFEPHSLTALEINSCSESNGYYINGEPCTWKYRQKIVVDSVITDTDLNDFPLLIKVTDQTHQVFDNAQEDGDDIVFTSLDGVKLNHEIEKFNTEEGNKELVAWVRVPVLSSDPINPTEGYMYYGNNGTTSQQNPQNVWDSNFTLVQHLQETIGAHYDSTSNNNDYQVDQVNVSAHGTAPGVMSGADEFDGVDDGIINGALLRNLMNLTDDIGTMSAWIKPAGEALTNDNIYYLPSALSDNWTCTGIFRGIYDSDNDGTGEDKIWVYNSCYSDPCIVGTDYVSDEWTHITWLKTGNTLALYKNGLESGSTSCMEIGDGRFNIGRGANLKGYFKGLIDEVRVSNVDRTPGWIKTSYSNQNSPDAYLTFGTIESCTDTDGDGYAVEGGVCGEMDCNDNDAYINPAADEICNSLDDNCDGNIDEGDVCFSDITVTPASKDFVNVNVGSVSPVQTFTISNNGTADLVIGGVYLTGTNPYQFSILNENCSEQKIAPSGTCTIEALYVPTKTGTMNADIGIDSNDSDTDPLYINLIGTGVEPDISATPLSMDFGSVIVGNLSLSQIFTISNDGTADLVIGGVYLTGTNPYQFSILNENCSEQKIAPSGTCTIEALYVPTKTGTMNAEIGIDSSDPDTPKFCIVLTGTGL